MTGDGRAETEREKEKETKAWIVDTTEVVVALEWMMEVGTVQIKSRAMANDDVGEASQDSARSSISHQFDR
jgi:hypothetical protein